MKFKMIYKIPTSLYGENGELISPDITFPVRGGMCTGDSVVVMRGDLIVYGILYFSEIMNVEFKLNAVLNTQKYDRYEKIGLYLNNRKVSISRIKRVPTNFNHSYVFEAIELQMYYSRVVLTEKYLKTSNPYCLDTKEL